MRDIDFLRKVCYNIIIGSYVFQDLYEPDKIFAMFCRVVYTEKTI